MGREAELPNFLQMVTSDTRARICYEGFRPPEELPKFFEESDVFVLPSRHDGWGVVINQALAAGLPIITSDMVGAGLDFVENGRKMVSKYPPVTQKLCIGPWNGLLQIEILRRVGASSSEKWRAASRQKLALKSGYRCSTAW